MTQLAKPPYLMSASMLDDMSFVAALDPAAWYRYGVGVSTAAWLDQSGNARDMAFTATPTVGAAGVTFNGTSQFGQASFTLAQPSTVSMLVSPISWTLNDVVFDGGSTGTGTRLLQSPTTPTVRINAGSGVADNTGMVVGTYVAVTVVINGASSSITVNQGAATTGDAGTQVMNGIALAADRGGLTGFANIAVKEAIVIPSALSAAAIMRVNRYLMRVGAL